MEEWKVEWLGQPTVFIHQQKPLGAHKKSNNKKKRGGRNVLCNILCRFQRTQAVE